MTDCPSAREAYFTRLGFDPKRPAKHDAQLAALKRAYELRSFEIELVWKRATYFLAVQTVLFAALGFASSAQFRGSPPLPLALSLTGFATAWLGYLAARGARFWQQNWEAHIDLLEDELEGRLHKTALYSGSVQFSVARAQIWLSLIIAVFWLIPVAVAWWEIAGWLAHSGWCNPRWPTMIFGGILVAGFTTVSHNALRSRLHGKPVALEVFGGRDRPFILHPRPAPGEPL